MDWTEVEEITAEPYRMIALKKLVAELVEQPHRPRPGPFGSRRRRLDEAAGDAAVQGSAPTIPRSACFRVPVWSGIRDAQRAARVSPARYCVGDTPRMRLKATLKAKALA